MLLSSACFEHLCHKYTENLYAIIRRTDESEEIKAIKISDQLHEVIQIIKVP